MYQENGQEFCEDLYSSMEGYLQEEEKDSPLIVKKESAKQHNENEVF
jgi:hypothetical protein